ncbi:uncharacterized protein [Dendrobates tinctorius]|uniref:uncharacterized protein n=1 Tax=Dendrobates tinctorius TaxID=92724 RepID=UPI003CCA46B2
MSRIINVEMLMILVQQRPELWDPRDARYANRNVKDAAWTYICRKLFPNYAKSAPDVQLGMMNDAQRRWRSCRDQYRRERQLHQKSGAGGGKKRPYIYMSQLNFLAPVMDLRPTESNLAEGDPASEAKPGQSKREAAVTVEDDVPSPSAEEKPIPVSQAQVLTDQEEHARSSSPTLALDISPQATAIPRRLRRRREQQSVAIRRQVDSRVLDYISRTISEDGEEAFGRSLAQHLRQIPQQLQLPTKAAILHLIHAAIPPNNPQHIFDYIVRSAQTQNITQLSDSTVSTPDPLSAASLHLPS